MESNRRLAADSSLLSYLYAVQFPNLDNRGSRYYRADSNPLFGEYDEGEQHPI